jgi:hypothetical protein
MPKKIALDLSGLTPRAITAQVASGSVTILAVDEIAIESKESQNDSQADVNQNLDAFAQGIKAWASRQKLAGTETLVLVGRRDVEVRNLQLPPVPDDELPDIVRLQAMRKFAATSERSPIDFVPLSRSSEGIDVLAASISPDSLAKIRSLIQAADLTLGRVSLRSLGLAALSSHAGSKADNRTGIARIDDETELVLFRGQHLSSIRSFRTPRSQETSVTARAMDGEVRRSRLAASCDPNQPSPLECWGDPTIADALGKIHPSTVTSPDPFSAVTLAGDVKSPANAESYAPLVGLLMADASGGRELIDFVNPRQRPEPKPDHRRTALLIGSPLLVLGSIGYAVWSQFANMDKKIQGLDQQLAEAKQPMEIANRSLYEAESVDEFLDGDVRWLEEVKRLADNMPPSDQMIVTEMSGMVPPRGGGGRLAVKGGVTSPSVLDGFASSMRDETHRVMGNGAKETPGKDSYRWTFNETIEMTPESIRQFRYEELNDEDSQESIEPNNVNEDPSEESGDQPEKDVAKDKVVS